MIGSRSTSTSTKESKRLTTAGLIAVTAATFLMLAWAILPTNAGAVTDECPAGWTTKVESQVDGDLDDIVLPAGTLFCAKGSTDATGILTADGQTTLFEYLGNDHNVSHYVTYPPQTTTTTTLPTTTTTVPTTTTTVPTTTTTVPTTTTTVPTTTTTTVTTTTTTVPGGGGGGGGGTTTVPVTTTTTPTVGPTTVQPSTTTKSPNVAPTTVSPRGTAFTGVENVVPIGAIALMLMTSGTGLLWAGSRRKRDQNQDEE
jgi:hypothetical protein